VQRFLELAVELRDAGSAAWSRLGHDDAGEEVFRWVASAGELSPFFGRIMPRNFSSCSLCFNAGKTILVSRPARLFTYFDDVDLPISEATIVPVHDTSGVALGTIWVVHHNEQTFARLVDDLAIQLVLALKLMGDVKTHGQSWFATLP
jgi:hypothetical protein